LGRRLLLFLLLVTGMFWWASFSAWSIGSDHVQA
jgi:hypothetical protein